MSEGIYIRTVDFLAFFLTIQIKHYFICKREMRSGRSIRLQSRAKKINPKRLKRIHDVLSSVTHGRGLGCYQAQITAAAHAWSHSASLLKFRSFDSRTLLLPARASAGTPQTAELLLEPLSNPKDLFCKMNMKEVTHVLVLI